MVCQRIAQALKAGNLSKLEDELDWEENNPKPCPHCDHGKVTCAVCGGAGWTRPDDAGCQIPCLSCAAGVAWCAECGGSGKVRVAE